MNLQDINIIEGDDAPIEDEAMAIQRAINSGSAWSFQGSYGRQMMDFIEAGLCMLGKAPARDYWGNRIPSRSEVMSGSKGSRAYVAAARGEEWAAMVEAA